MIHRKCWHSFKYVKMNDYTDSCLEILYSYTPNYLTTLNYPKIIICDLAICAYFTEECHSI